MFGLKPLFVWRFRCIFSFIEWIGAFGSLRFGGSQCSFCCGSGASQSWWSGWTFVLQLSVFGLDVCHFGLWCASFTTYYITHSKMWLPSYIHLPVAFITFIKHQWWQPACSEICARCLHRRTSLGSRLDLFCGLRRSIDSCGFASALRGHIGMSCFAQMLFPCPRVSTSGQLLRLTTAIYWLGQVNLHALCSCQWLWCSLDPRWSKAWPHQDYVVGLIDGYAWLTAGRCTWSNRSPPAPNSVHIVQGCASWSGCADRSDSGSILCSPCPNVEHFIKTIEMVRILHLVLWLHRLLYPYCIAAPSWLGLPGRPAGAGGLAALGALNGTESLHQHQLVPGFSRQPLEEPVDCQVVEMCCWPGDECLDIGLASNWLDRWYAHGVTIIDMEQSGRAECSRSSSPAADSAMLASHHISQNVIASCRSAPLLYGNMQSGVFL